MTLTLEEQSDLVLGVLADLGEGHWQNLMNELTHYEGMPMILKNAKETDTHTIKRKLGVKSNPSTRQVGKRDPDVTNRTDGMIELSVPLRDTTSNYQYERTEMDVILRTKDRQKIYDGINFNRLQTKADQADHLETQFWGRPSDPTDKLNTWGVSHWIVDGSTTGYSGLAPTGFTDVGGVSATTYPQTANYYHAYTGITEEHFLEELDDAYRATNWVSPVSMPEYVNAGKVNAVGGPRDINIKRRSMYMNKDVQKGVNRLLRSRNDLTGYDLGVYGDGTAHYKRIPLIYIPYFDADSTDPVFGIDWNYMEIYTLKGNKFHQTKTLGEPNHNWFTIHEDLSWNILCFERRRQIKFKAA